jgi:hypothetical protein
MDAAAPSAVGTQEAAVTAAVSPKETVAAASRRLRELASTLDTQGISSAAQVAATLQQLSEQLLQLHTPATATSTSAAAGARAASVEPAAAGERESEAAVEEAADTATPAAADVEVLERSYAAPAAVGAADTEEMTALQPLTKKQRRGRQSCC